MPETKISTLQCDDERLSQLLTEAAEKETVTVFVEGPRHCEFSASLPDDFEAILPELWQVRMFNEEFELAARRITFGESGEWRLRTIGDALVADVEETITLEEKPAPKSLGMLGTFRAAGEAGTDDQRPAAQQVYAKNGFYENRYRKPETVTYSAEGVEREPGIAYPTAEMCKSGDVSELNVAVHSMPDGNGEIVRWCGFELRHDDAAENLAE